MAVGIDDILSAAAAGINLADTAIKTIVAYRRKGADFDIERLIEEVRITALQRIDEADLALTQLERTLIDKGVNMADTLQESISSTPWWRPDEAHRLKRIKRSFDVLADATYSAVDDIAALARCKDQTTVMGTAVIESARQKHNLNSQLSNAKSVKSAIDILREQLIRHKEVLM
jgi:hypothetical protein